MPVRPPKTCRVCGRGEDEVGSISWRGYCAIHGDAVQVANVAQLRAREGPYFDHWKRRIAQSVGGVLVDDPASEE